MPAEDPARSDDVTDTLVHRAIERLHRGDPFAKNDLLAYAQQQLVRMARQMLYRTPAYDVVRRWEQTDDVVQGSLIRLSRTIDQHPINSPRDFFKLAATNIRWELGALRDKYRAGKSHAANHVTDVQPNPAKGGPVVGGILDNTEARPDPFTEMSRYLDVVETLAEEHREVLDLILVNGLTRQEAADQLGMSLGTFKRRYADAVELLGKQLED
jgi:RNA polymerase sigma factor (sigma-70 family)